MNLCELYRCDRYGGKNKNKERKEDSTESDNDSQQ